MRDGYADTPKGQVHYVTDGEGENADDNVNWFDPPLLANAILDYVKQHPIRGGTGS